MPPPVEQQFVLKPVLDRLKEVMKKAVAWRGQIVAKRKLAFQVEDLMDLLTRVSPILDLRQAQEDTTGGDVWGAGDHNPDNSQLVDAYNVVNCSHDLTLPFKQLLSWYDQRPATMDALWNIGWRLSAGYDWMMGGQALAQALPVAGPPEEFWEGLFIESCGYGPPTMKGKPQLTLNFRILGGKYAGLRFSQNITYFIVTRKIACEIGFPKFKKTHYSELVKCIFIGRVVLENRGDKLVPRVSEYHVTTGVKSFNMRVRKKRNEPCPYEGYTWPCHRCSRGYAEIGPTSCSRAVQPQALVRRPCPQCNRDSFFDPSSESKVCVSCQAAPYKRLEN